MPPTGNHAAINVRAIQYYVARTSGICRHCSQPTPLLALGLPPGHEILELDGEAEDETGAVDTWSVAGQAALLFYIEYLPHGVLERLAELSRAYRAQGESETARHWANHCEHCDALLDDEELCCEPGGAFLPAGEADAAVIRLLTIDAPFEASAGGYAYHPEFLIAVSGE